MTDDEKARRKAERITELQTMGLVVALERANGKITFPQEEYKAILERHGGPTTMSIHVEVVRRAHREPEVELTLVSKPPGHGDDPPA